MRVMPIPRTKNRRSSGADTSTMLACALRGILLIALILTMSNTANAQSLTFGTATGGIAISGTTANFGNMNGLGIGASASPTAVPMSNGTLYYSPINMTVQGGGLSTKASVTAYVSTNG